jgi:hypothetical protein
LKQNIKHSLKKKGRQLDAEIKRFKQDAANSESASKRSELGQTKGAKRKAIELCNKHYQQLQQEEWNRNTLVSG